MAVIVFWEPEIGQGVQRAYLAIITVTLNLRRHSDSQQRSTGFAAFAGHVAEGPRRFLPLHRFPTFWLACLVGTHKTASLC